MNDCARKEEAVTPLLKSGRQFLKYENQGKALCQGHKGKLGWHACYFPSLLSLIIKKGRSGKDGNSRAVLSFHNRSDNCVPLTCGSQTKTRPHIEPVLVVCKLLTDDYTKARHSFQL